ncbi:E3 ubiquitin-protein ligase UBR2-like isoform X2 [Tigriopus californicus]|nr:E3 ubiquitin-protein ligase UBR2-like isoform X2 [Tigriopus californicus]
MDFPLPPNLQALADVLQRELGGFEDEDSQPMPDLKTTEDVLHYWNNALEKDNLACHHFRQWWRRIVPKLFCPKFNMDYQSPNAHLDEDEIQRLLLAPLEQFLCNGDPEPVMERLAELNRPRATCGKKFRSGDATYSCWDCGQDFTCVLCVNCFKQSKHQFHSYKMAISTGNGICDCGDTEAWKADPHCDTHALGTQTGPAEPILSKVPPEIQVRGRYVLMSVMKYCLEVLTLPASLTLPADLTYRQMDSFEDMTAEDSYSTIIFNDEEHTFDDVIATLTRAIECDRNAAKGLATLIDREGRCLVKCSGFQNCNDVKRITERITSRRNSKPLKVVVMNSYVMAHQNFAMRLLDWLQGILEKCDSFIALFAIILQEKDLKDRCSMLETIFRNDTVLWKATRKQTHHLLITTMLFDNETKRQFASLFTQCYGQMMKDYIQDDHDHSFSIHSFSIQLFTAPTLAHHLVANDDVLAKLLTTFMSECEGRRNEFGKLDFQESLNNLSPRRPDHYITSDLRYLLRTPPEVDAWTDQLRKGFLHGVTLLLDILYWMQGMDLQTRQTTHHLEYELEWRSAFSLHNTIAPLTYLVMEWASRDRVVFIKTLRMLLKKLYFDLKEADKNPATSVTYETVRVQAQEATCIAYQVSSRPISMHAPLTRLLAGLSLYMQRFNLTFDSNELNILAKPNPIQMIEPSLRTVVLVAQVHAGMWRRNGYSLTDQIRTYVYPNRRKEMLDQDIIMLQLGAALIEPNQYLINLMYKFNLAAWAEKNFDCSEDDSIRQIIALVEEFLGTLLTILGERYVVGVGEVTEEDVLRKEIIQLLCIKNMPHWSLNKSIGQDISKETGLDQIVESVAVFNRTGERGVYELKKDFFDEYNVFFYHYSKEDQSKSEETLLEKKREHGLPKCNPPPKPPPFTKEFLRVVDIIESDVFLYIVSLVLMRADNLKSRCFSEGQVQRVLFLIGTCLHEEQRSKEDPNAPKKVEFTAKASKFDIFKLLSQLVGSQRIDSHKELLAWTLKKWQDLSVEDIGACGQGSSRMDTESGADSSRVDALEARKRKKAMAEARRAKILAQMKSAQSNFVKENKNEFEEISSGLEKQRNESVCSEIDTIEDVEGKPICLGPKKSNSTPDETLFTCILCQEEQALTSDGPALVMASFIQLSTVLSKKNLGEDESSESTLQYRSCPILTSDMATAPFVASCGHIMHATCWKKYFDDIVAHERQRNRIRHTNIFDVEKQEFLCPLCRCLSNSVIPLIAPFHLLQPQTTPKEGETERSNTKNLEMDFTQWIQALQIVLKYKRELTEEPKSPTDAKSGDSKAMEAETKVVSSVPRRKHYYTCPLTQIVHEMEEESHDGRTFSQMFTHQLGKELEFSASIFDMLHVFATSVYGIGCDALPDSQDERVPLMMWKACAYTVYSNVLSELGEEGKSSFEDMSLRQKVCLSKLIRVCGIIGTNFGEPKVIQSHSLKLLSTLMEVDTANLSILEYDAFGLLVSLTFALPSLFVGSQEAPLPAANCQDLHLLHLVFVAHLVQIMLTTDQFTHDVSDVEEEACPSLRTTECDIILKFLQIIREAVGFASDSDGSEGLRADMVWMDLKRASLPFLRAAAVFYHHLSGVPAPTGLQHHQEAEFDALTHYLGLPSSPAKILAPPILITLAKKWANHPHVHIMLSTASKIPPVTYPVKVNGLIDLPEDYADLINSVCDFNCSDSLCNNTRAPAMCLICGEVLCSQSLCCQTTIGEMNVGACTAHAEKCGAGKGVFLRIRESRVMLLSGRTKGCFIHSPYLDRYGETDLGLKRGFPLKLCRSKLDKIQNLWIEHKIPEKIAYASESNYDFINTPWHNM